MIYSPLPSIWNHDIKFQTGVNVSYRSGARLMTLPSGPVSFSGLIPLRHLWPRVTGGPSPRPPPRTMLVYLPPRCHTLGSGRTSCGSRRRLGKDRPTCLILDPVFWPAVHSSPPLRCTTWNSTVSVTGNITERRKKWPQEGLLSEWGTILMLVLSRTQILFKFLLCFSMFFEKSLPLGFEK